MKLTNKYDLPKSFVHAVENLCYDPRESDPNRISVTSLISNPRVRILTLKHYDEVEEDVSDHIWRIMGSAAHWVLAQADKDKEKSKDRLIEEKLTAEVDGITIVGKLDLYDGKELSIEDWKFTSCWSVKFGEHAEWEQQVNPYAWLLRKTGFRVEKAQINAIIKDWRRAESLKYPDYPKIPFVKIPVKLWSFEEQEEFIKHRVEVWKTALQTPIEELPYCTPQERWKSDDVFAVYKNDNKTASRLLDTRELAEEWATQNLKEKDKYRIEPRIGVDRKCTEYCLCNKFCNYYKETYGNKTQADEKIHYELS